jgi:hypothetical protein
MKCCVKCGKPLPGLLEPIEMVHHCELAMNDLPLLPKPAAEALWWEQNGFNARELTMLREHPDVEKYWGDRDKLALFTADQMRSYGEACAKAARTQEREPMQLAASCAAYAMFVGAQGTATPADVRKAIVTLFGAEIDAQLAIRARKP